MVFNTKLDGLIKLRHVQAGDLGFIFSTWLKGLYHGNDWFREIDQETYVEKYSKVVETILFSPNVQVEVLCLKEDPDVIIGYSVSRGRTLDWVWVRRQWRKLGLAKQIVSDDINVVSHLTKIGRSLKPKHWKFDPFL